MLNEHQKELLSNMDYQIMNSGMFGWLGNRGYRTVFEVLDLLTNRNSVVDQKVASILKIATISAIEYYQNKDSAFIPEIREIVVEAEREIETCSKQYQEIAEEFMNSYGLEDYGSKFMRRVGGEA